MKPFELETCTVLHYFIFDFLSNKKNDKIRTRDRSVIKTLILYQRKNSIQ
jgi:hypothetical protein